MHHSWLSRSHNEWPTLANFASQQPMPEVQAVLAEHWDQLPAQSALVQIGVDSPDAAPTQDESDPKYITQQYKQAPAQDPPRPQGKRVGRAAEPWKRLLPSTPKWCWPARSWNHWLFQLHDPSRAPGDHGKGGQPSGPSNHDHGSRPKLEKSSFATGGGPTPSGGVGTCHRPLLPEPSAGQDPHPAPAKVSAVKPLKFFFGNITSWSRKAKQYILSQKVDISH